jgi:hypothetical protein
VPRDTVVSPSACALKSAFFRDVFPCGRCGAQHLHLAVAAIPD